MNSRKALKAVAKVLRDNSKWLVPAVTGAGLTTTAYLASKATVKAVDEVREDEMRHGVPENDTERIKNAVRISWEYYIPATLVGLTTLGVVSVGSYSMAKRTVAAVSAATLTEKAFTEYRRAVVNEIGEKQERVIREATATKQVIEQPPKEANVIIVGNKTVTCCELHTGRYFKSDMETIKSALNEINSRILHEYYVTLDEFYELIGLPATTTSCAQGWDSDRLLELEFATVLHDDTPCLTFRYNYIKTI